MFRSTTVYSGELTFREVALETLGGVRGAKYALKTLTVWLRKKAKQEGWVYDFRLTLSTSKPGIYNRKPARVHAHFIIIGNPGTTIAQFIQSYWHQRYGMVNLERLTTVDDIRRKTDYIDRQADFTWHQKLNIGQIGEELETILDRAALETNQGLESE